MREVCVITGGGSGMGLAAAKELGDEYQILITGRTIEKLQAAVEDLKSKGIDAEGFPCDVSNRKAVEKLAEYASNMGNIKVVIHAAGLSPNMGSAETIMRINAAGTVNVNEVFYGKVIQNGCIINVSSMSGHLVPKMFMPSTKYSLSTTNIELFLKKMMNRVSLFPKKHQSGVSYSISKNFVIWYAQMHAEKFAKRGIRVLSISPGLFETPMADAERELSQGFVEKCAIKRYGRVEEIAYLFKVLSNEKAGYLTGVDILCDGGCIASGTKGLLKV